MRMRVTPSTVNQKLLDGIIPTYVYTIYEQDVARILHTSPSMKGQATSKRVRSTSQIDAEQTDIFEREDMVHFQAIISPSLKGKL